MAKKEKKMVPVSDDVFVDDLTATITDIRERFRKLVRGSYFPQRKVVEFVAYLDSLKPKEKADATSKPAGPTATTAGPSLRP